MIEREETVYVLKAALLLSLRRDIANPAGFCRSGSINLCNLYLLLRKR
jgi:hypothetical protein